MSVVSAVVTLAQAIATDIKALYQAVAAAVPRVQSPIYYDLLAGNAYTVTAADAGKWFIWNGTADLVMTFPSTLPEGLTLKVSQFNSGKVTFQPGGRTYFSNGSAPGLILPGQSAQCTTATVVAGGNPVPILSVLLDFPLPVFLVANTSSFTRNATALTTVPGLAFTADADSTYEIDMMMTFTAANATNALKLGLSALPTGASCQLEGRIYSTSIVGTTASQSKTMLSSAECVNGFAGSGAMTSANLLGRIIGRITTGPGAGGTIQITAGSLNTAGAISVATGAATMRVRKIK